MRRRILQATPLTIQRLHDHDRLGAIGVRVHIVRMTGWKIAAAEHRIPWRSSIAAHKMVIVVDPQGQAVRQLNGLASWFDAGAKRWRHKPIGYLRTDRLRAYDTLTHPQTWLPINGADPRSRSVDAAISRGDVVTMADGMDRGALEFMISPALAVLKRINEMSDGADGSGGLRYPFLGIGPNSNSVFTTFLKAMDLDEPVFPRPARFVPGAGQSLLSEHEIFRIRDRREQVDSLES